MINSYYKTVAKAGVFLCISPSGAGCERLAAADGWLQCLPDAILAPKGAVSAPDATHRAGSGQTLALKPRPARSGWPRWTAPCRRTRRLALDVLIQDRWIETRQIGQNGTVNACVINDRVAPGRASATTSDTACSAPPLSLLTTNGQTPRRTRPAGTPAQIAEPVSRRAAASIWPWPPPTIRACVARNGA